MTFYFSLIALLPNITFIRNFRHNLHTLNKKGEFLCRIIGDAHVETLGADMTIRLATHAITTEIIETTGMTNEETIDTMDTDMTDAIGATIIVSGLGDN